MIRALRSSRWLLAAAALASTEAQALDFCYCEKPPLSAMCKEECAKPGGQPGVPRVVSTPPPTPPSPINPFAVKPDVFVLDKENVYDRIPAAKDGLRDKMMIKGGTPAMGGPR